ncbi:MAG: hypothetical protein R3C53_03990 [Pirellulaceae bacterium]
MTPREKILALGVGAIVGGAGIFYGIDSMRAGLEDKRTTAENAKLSYEKAEMIIASGFVAGDKFNKLKAKSLPADEELLATQYSQWLLQLGKESGLRELAVNPLSSEQGGSYKAFKFSLTGKCSEEQVIDLLGKFYDKDYLHTIEKLSLLPNPNAAGEVNVTLDAKALKLNGAGSNQPPSKESSGRLAMQIDEYKQKIMNRNLFSPPNQAPSLATSRTQEIPRGQPWRLKLEGKDPENHRVEFELVSTELPPGMKFSRQEFSWSPSENGEYEVTVRAKDNGWPSQTSEEKLTFKVVDPPVVAKVEKPPEFDKATQAFVTAIMGGRGGSEGWLRSRIDGETIHLKEGEEFEVGSIKAKVLSVNINEDFVELETDGKRWTIGMDTSLAEAFNKSQVD